MRKMTIIFGVSAYLFSSTASFALPVDVIATAVGKAIVALGGKSYSNNLNSALRQACGSSGEFCSIRQLCTYLKVVNFPVDCAKIPDQQIANDPRTAAFESFLKTLPKPQSCLDHEAKLLADAMHGVFHISPDNPVYALGAQCKADNESMKLYAVAHSDEILDSLGM